MKKKKEEQKNARRALEKVKPVARVAVAENVVARFNGDENAVNRMKQERHENAENLDKNQIRHIVNVLYVLVKARRAVHRRRVCVHMHKEKRAERDDARQLMQLAQQKSFAHRDRHKVFTLGKAKYDFIFL